MTRILITGLGCVSALGRDVPAFSEALFAGTCGIGPISRFDASTFRVRIAAEVASWSFPETAPAPLGAPAPREDRLDRFSQFAVVASREAVKDAGLELEPERVAVVHGTGVGGQESHEVAYQRIYGERATRLHPLTVPRLMPSAAASHISLDLGITGPTMGIVSACASAGHAICMGAMLLRSGMADVALVGGAEACITPGTFRGWESLRVMAHDTCRPFSKGRGGMVIGEGAATLVLETERHARERGARARAELAGIGMSSDAHDLVQPSSEGMARTMRLALSDAGVAPAAIDYVNAHGTGTGHNDVAETAALHGVFGVHASDLPVSSTKSMCGHLLGASSALEAVATVLSLERQMAPPTIGYQAPDPECDLDYVPNAARPMRIEVAQSNSFGFGGLNAVVIFRRYRS